LAKGYCQKIIGSRILKGIPHWVGVIIRENIPGKGLGFGGELGFF